jgi:hypothetical protein
MIGFGGAMAAMIKSRDERDFWFLRILVNYGTRRRENIECPLSLFYF